MYAHHQVIEIIQLYNFTVNEKEHNMKESHQQTYIAITYRQAAEKIWKD